MPEGKITTSKTTAILKLMPFKDIHGCDRGVLYRLHRTETGKRWHLRYWVPYVAFPGQDWARGNFLGKPVMLACWGNVAITSLSWLLR